MSKRTIAGVLTAVAALATLSATTTAEAAPTSAKPAAASCTVSIDLPPTIGISSLDQTLPTTLRGCDGQVYDAVAELDSPSGQFWTSMDWWDPGHRTNNADLDVRDSPPPGTYSITLANGFLYDASGTSGGQTLTFAPLPSTVLKYGTRASLTPNRSGTQATITATLQKFTVADGWLPYAGRKVSFEAYVSGAWHSIAGSITNDSGQATVNNPNPDSVPCRVVVADNDSYQGTTTAAAPC